MQGATWRLRGKAALEDTGDLVIKGLDPSVYVLLYMLDCGAAASFHIRPTYTDDEDVVATQR